MQHILVIEDEQGIRENIKEILSLEGFYVITAENGSVGVQMAKEDHPDLILCDVMMPELDGFGVLKALRRNSLTATIPVIFLTAKSSHSDMREGMELGADDYITKPFTPSELLKSIATRLEKYEVAKKESIAKLDVLRRNIANSLPHEMLTPLSGILGLSEIILSDYDFLSKDEILESVQNIYLSGQRLHRLARNFMLFAELEATAASYPTWKDDPDCSAVKDIIASAAYACAEKANRVDDLEMELEEAIVKILPKHLTKVIEEIVENAFKFSTAGSPVKVTSKVDVNAQVFNLYIVDHGRGMTDEQIANIGAYMQFERKHYEQQGNGLGLILAKRIAETYGGEFSIENILSNQTVVCIKLPM
ncbi:hybrid sensor histidine kinase/response regulator [Pseudanabaena sp. Chao 1811]|uniref:hybrid sensor histidine kinase/response regulator n=1 Tax=Pseudanabaena sp. Chao 1811 TaxID=2963092 RepID=UPI0022F39AA6|nr:response regulator [Pseudanabaena sp. Chao 1811]